jgi:hypothetical protein
MSEQQPPDPNATGAYDAAAPTPAERFAPGAVLAGRYRIAGSEPTAGCGHDREGCEDACQQPHERLLHRLVHESASSSDGRGNVLATGATMKSPKRL